MKHADMPAGEIHTPHNFECADEAARLAVTGFVSGDLGWLARQLDGCAA